MQTNFRAAQWIPCENVTLQFFDFFSGCRSALWSLEKCDVPELQTEGRTTLSDALTAEFAYHEFMMDHSACRTREQQSDNSTEWRDVF